jgi:hypothetical protein
MLRSLKSLIGYRIHATDGEMGHVDDFYFDDRDWSVRHIAVDLGQWRYRRQILLAPKAVQDDSMNRVLAVPLTRRQVEERPGIDTDPPVAKQEEKIFHTYYAWPPYVGGGGFFSMDPFVPEFYFQASLHDPPTSPFEVVGQANGDRHLQSARELVGYRQRTDQSDMSKISCSMTRSGGSVTWSCTRTNGYRPPNCSSRRVLSTS